MRHSVPFSSPSSYAEKTKQRHSGTRMVLDMMELVFIKHGGGVLWCGVCVFGGGGGGMGFKGRH